MPALACFVRHPATWLLSSRSVRTAPRREVQLLQKGEASPELPLHLFDRREQPCISRHKKPADFAVAPVDIFGSETREGPLRAGRTPAKSRYRPADRGDFPGACVAREARSKGSGPPSTTGSEARHWRTDFHKMSRVLVIIVLRAKQVFRARETSASVPGRRLCARPRSSALVPVVGGTNTTRFSGKLASIRLIPGQGRAHPPHPPHPPHPVSSRKGRPP